MVRTEIGGGLVMKNQKNDQQDLSRRDFIKAAGVTTAGLAAGSLILNQKGTARAEMRWPASPKIIGANDRIRYGFIGLGMMGKDHVPIIKGLTESENVAVEAVCDIYEKRRRVVGGKAGVPEDRTYSDYRRLLDNKDIDVVVIAVPEHWHHRVAVDAMEAGKHIYLEKPMTRTAEEAIKVWQTARKTKRQVQVGAHGASDPKWHKARDIIKSGRMGHVHWAQGSYCRNNPKGEWNYQIEPEANEQTIDWKTWLGNTRKIPFSAERFFRWRKYWDYSSGIIGDLWPHRLHPLMLAMSLNEFPQSVSCVGANLCDYDKGNGEPREVADTTLLLARFPSGAMITLAGSTVNERGLEDVIRGQKANLFFGGGKVQLTPERPFVDEIEARDETPPDSGESHLKHQKNFIYALRNNVPPNCDIELAVRVQIILSMAEMSYRKGKMFHFDASRLKITS
jgi:predicted dehydrogenase